MVTDTTLLFGFILERHSWNDLSNLFARLDLSWELLNLGTYAFGTQRGRSTLTPISRED